ncbi:MAG: hypothetical protein Q8Q32_03500 [bacterium]|nr:hypothetical protein [bacterium]
MRVLMYFIANHPIIFALIIGAIFFAILFFYWRWVSREANRW